jgi:hypothetical protein
MSEAHSGSDRAPYPGTRFCHAVERSIIPRYRPDGYQVIQTSRTKCHHRMELNRLFQCRLALRKGPGLPRLRRFDSCFYADSCTLRVAVCQPPHQCQMARTKYCKRTALAASLPRLLAPISQTGFSTRVIILKPGYVLNRYDAYKSVSQVVQPFADSGGHLAH